MSMGLFMEPKMFSLTCPECRGPMATVGTEGRQLQCRVGHLYSPASFYEGYSETMERTLWSALVALEEAAEISERMQKQLPEFAGQLKAEHQSRREAAVQLRAIITALLDGQKK